MIDHLLCFADAQAAQTAISQYWIPAGDDGPATWRGDVCIPSVAVYVVMGTETMTDQQTGQSWEQEIKQYYPGWFMIVALPSLNPMLRDLPDNACRLIADREAAIAGSPSFLRYVAADMDPVDLAAARVEPTFAGSNYPFGTM